MAKWIKISKDQIRCITIAHIDTIDLSMLSVFQSLPLRYCPIILLKYLGTELIEID